MDVQSFIRAAAYDKSMRHEELRRRSLAPSRIATERPDASLPTRASVVQAVSLQLRAQARSAASPINAGLKK